MTDTCQREITIGGYDKADIHHFEESFVTTGTEDEDSSYTNIRSYICSLCDSSKVIESTYSKQYGYQMYYKTVYTNNLLLNEDKQRTHINEYADNERFGNYLTRSYNENIHCDGSKDWSENLYTYDFDYVGPFSDENAYIRYESYRNSSGYTSGTDYAYDYYKGYELEIYIYHYEGSDKEMYWYRYDFEYDFSTWCTRTETYTSSDGEYHTNTTDWHLNPQWIVDKQNTCTQLGHQIRFCDECKNNIDECDITPIQHSWYQISDDHYFCTICGLENANGANGDIVIEDLTSQYGNGTHYVLGYYNKQPDGMEVEFSYYVSLILHQPLEDGNDEVILMEANVEFLDGIKAIKFSREEVEALALAYGFTPDQYYIRFSFVPFGADGSYDYGITFTPEVEVETVGAGFYVDNINGESVTVTVVVEESGEYLFRSYGNNYAYGCLYDAYDKCLAESSYNFEYGNFGFYYYLEAGVEYQFSYRIDKYRDNAYVGISIELK
jgi:hypothetical protein